VVCCQAFLHRFAEVTTVVPVCGRRIESDAEQQPRCSSHREAFHFTETAACARWESRNSMFAD